jgi:proton-dependent oligopeptide transporter, POT family
MPENKFTHPTSLRAFFATEMWERYGFYVVQTLLTLYLVLHFKWSDQKVYALVGSFTALAYLTPLVGGWIADNLLGQKRVILIGAIILMLSYLLLSVASETLLLNLSLAGITVGTGLLKPNISSLLGNEYPEGSPHRENGFLIFYIGLTIGIVLGTTLPSYLNDHFGWSVAFLSASIGMVLATFIFSFSIYWCKIKDYFPHKFQLKNTSLAIILIIALWCIAFYILNYPKLADLVFSVVIISSIIYFFWCIKDEPKEQARHTIALGLLCFIAVMFWAFNFQIFLSLTLFILRVVQPTLFGINIPPPYYVGIESIGMIILGLAFVSTSNKLNKIQQGMRVSNKFLLSMVTITIGYMLIVGVCYLPSKPDTLLSPLYIIPVYLIFSLAEILLSPVGLYAVTLLASPKKVSTLMGIFLAAIGFGSFFSGKLAGLTAMSQDELLTVDIKIHYAHTFGLLLLILMGATLLCAVLNLIIKRLIQPKKSLII